MSAYITADGSICGGNEGEKLDTPEAAARTALKYADALIAALAEAQG